MKHILPFALFLLFSFSLSAQIEIAPSPLTVEKAVDLSDEWIKVTAHSSMSNTSTSFEELRWEITKIDGPDEWTVQVCDSIACYGWGVPSNIDAAFGTDTPTPIGPGEAGRLDPGIRPSGVAGTGSYRIDVALASDPATIIATNTYTFIITAETTNTEEFEKAAVKLFPNPTSNFFQITENEFVNEVEIFNIVGKRMIAAQHVNGKSYDISGFPNGLYLVRMTNEEGQILKTTRLTKR